MARSAWLFLSTLVLAACGTRNALDGLGDRDCIPKSSEVCVCVDGKSGTRTCAADGSGWSACSCSPNAGKGGAAGKAGAAGSGTAGTGTAGTGTGGKAGSGTGGKAGSGTAGTGTGGSFDQCWKQDPDTCFQCCDDVTNGGVNEYQFLIIQECGCGKFAVCPKECSPFCASQNLDQACVDCLNGNLQGGEQCINVFYEQCQQSSSCSGGLECAQNCGF